MKKFEAENLIVYKMVTLSTENFFWLIFNELHHDKTCFLSHLLIARCDIGVQLSVRSSVRSFVRSFVRPSVHNLCQGAYSVAVIAGSMKPSIVVTLDTHFKKAP